MAQKSELSANIEAVYPLSPMQEGMLFHTLLSPDSGIYLMQNRYRLEGALDAVAFEAAWETVVARHAMLRTAFVWKTQKRPLQVVHKQVALPFELLDLRALSEQAQEARIASELRREREQGIDLGKAPPMRIRLVQRGEQEHELIHSFHHILLDEWCTSVLMMDFIAHYEARLRGEPLSLPPSRPFRAYVEWLAQRNAAATEAFWRDAMRGFEGATPLPIVDEQASTAGEVVDLAIRVNRETTRALEQLAQQNRLTLNTIVQGAYALLLSRYSGQRDVLFGVTVAGRPPELPDVDTMIGLFINTLPLRVSVAPEQPLVPFLKALLGTNLTLRDYEHTPLVDIQRVSEVPRGQELFHSLFVFENAPIDPALSAGRTFRVREVRDRVHTNYPITVMAWPDEQLGLKVSYDTARVSAEAALRLLEHLRALLSRMAARPNACLGDLTLLTDTEREAALADARGSEVTEDLSSYALRFEAQVRRTPDAVAARYVGETLSYVALNARANRVAHALRAQGVGPESRVALLEDRGLGLLTAILGVFKAGGAYVPIDPEYPVERIALMIAASAPSVLVTSGARLADVACALEKLPTRPSVITLEEILNGSFSDVDPAPRGGPDNLAYVIYTSGSTGVPKGAMVARRGMLNNMLSKVPLLGLSGDDLIAQTASACFDISVWQHLTALLIGATVEIVPDEIAREPARLVRHVEQTGVSILEVVPAVLQGMLEEASALSSPRARLRWILPTGEALPVPLARAWLTAYPAVPLMNAYGPAECSDDVSLHPVVAPPRDDVRSIPIGRPVAGLSVHVLDLLLAPTPLGVTGELYVGGIGVGRGYLGDPARTAAAFVPDPFSARPGARLYRTGDAARRRADATLEFAGRRDHQIKLRGLRIELGEIEARLLALPHVHDAVVALREDKQGAQQLVGYIVPAPGEPPTAEALRARLRVALPRHMVPAVFVLLEVLPRTPNGKVDRKRLPAPERGARDFVAPRGETEQKLAEIWAEVLGVAQVGAEDEFYELGGHSLQLTQVLARVRRVFDVEVALRALFEAPTLAAQALEVDAARVRPSASLPPLFPAPAGAEPPPLSYAQERLWFLAELDPEAAAYNVPAAVRLVGALDHARLSRCFTLLAERHEALRTRFVERDDKPVLVIDPPEQAGLRLPAALDVSALAEPERSARARELLEQAAGEPLALREGALARAILVRLSDQEHWLGLVLHHAVSDGWSLALLWREAAALYAVGADLERAQLPALTLQYTDYARWQRGWLGGPIAERQLVHFKKQLSGAPLVLELPTDRPRPALRSSRGARHPFAVDAALGEALAARARERGVTQFVLLLAAFEVLVARFSGQPDFCIGTPVAGRTHAELEGLAGLFVNTVVLRADLSDDPAFDALLERSREQVLAAQAHQELPFERLVQALKPPRDLGRTPVFQVLFSLQERERTLPPLAGLALAPLELDPGTAQFDLSLHMGSDVSGLSGSLEYASELFEASTIGRLADAFVGLLAAIAERPDTRVGALPWPTFPARSTLTDTFAAAPGQPTKSVAVDPAALAEAEARIAAIWSEVLRREVVQPEDDFFELGGDSILSLDVVARARRAGLRVSARQVFQYPTPRGLARAALTAARGLDDAQGLVTGELALLPIQRRFFARGLPNPHHWNQALLLSVAEPLAKRPLEQAVEVLIRHHDALRLRFRFEGSTPRAVYADEGAPLPVHFIDLSSVRLEAQADAIAAHAARWQASLDLASGPLLRVVAFDLGVARPARLLVVVHHLVMDGVSFRVLLDDLESAYDGALRGEPIVLPDKTASLTRWGEQLARAARSTQLDAAAQQWLALPWERVIPLVVDDPIGDRSEHAMATLDVALDAARTEVLRDVAPVTWRARIDEVLLTALALALTEGASSRVVALDVEGHGREELGLADATPVDLSRTVGWLTSVYPAVLDLGAAHAPREQLVRVKEQLRSLPRGGLAFGVLRELGEGPRADALRALPAAQVAFNYLGQWDQVVGEGARFSLAPEATGPEHDPASPLPYELEIDAALFGGKLEVSFRYSHARLAHITVEALSKRFLRALEQLVDAARDPTAAAYTPSDFPDVALSTAELDAILEQMD